MWSICVVHPGCYYEESVKDTRRGRRRGSAYQLYPPFRMLFPPVDHELREFIKHGYFIGYMALCSKLRIVWLLKENVPSHCVL